MGKKATAYEGKSLPNLIASNCEALLINWKALLYLGAQQKEYKAIQRNNIGYREALLVLNLKMTRQTGF